jgi:hypothetical protein
MVQLEGLGKLKNAVTSLGFEPVTFWLVAQHLNQLCYHMPQNHDIKTANRRFENVTF